MALGIGYGLPFVAQHGTNPYKTQWAAALEGAKGAGASVEDENAGTGSCLVARGQDVYTDGLPSTPSMLIVPQFYKAGNLYQDVPPFVAEDSTMRFTVSRNTTATRVNSSGLVESVASGVPRIDWLGQSCPGLLVEPSAQNGILNSADTTTNWTLGANLTSGSIDVIGVSGNNISIAVSGSSIGSAAGRFVRFNNNVALASGSTYTVSFLMKKTGAHTIGGYQLVMSSGVIGSGFDVSGSFASGSNVDTAPTTNRIRRIEQFATDVFRCSETFTMTAAATGLHLAFGPVSTVSVSTNSAVGTQLGFAAPQIELGAFPTSFIPTTSGAGSRAADVISASGALVSGLIGQTEGTMYFEVSDVKGVGTGTGNPALSIRDTATTNWIGLISNNTALPFRIQVKSTTTTLINYTSAITEGKAAIAYSASGAVVYVNGLEVASTATNPNLTLNIVTMQQYMPFKVKSLALYTTRLSNDQLAELTRL